MKTLTLGFVVAGAALGGCSAERGLRPLVSPKATSVRHASAVVGGTMKENTTILTGTVEEIDSESREITLRRPDGTSITIIIEPGVDDLDRFETGDQVSLTYRESIAFQVKKPDQLKPGVAHTRDVTRASAGEKPGGSVTDTLDVRAPIAAIDRAASVVTLRNFRGGTAVMAVPEPDTLDAVAVGDIMAIAYTTALAITVQKAAP